MRRRILAAVRFDCPETFPAVRAERDEDQVPAVMIDRLDVLRSAAGVAVRGRSERLRLFNQRKPTPSESSSSVRLPLLAVTSPPEHLAIWESLPKGRVSI